jgi:histidinol phosphatase-like PHP family hydrolase
MRSSCLHTHTAFCDGTGDIEDFCQTAYERGLSVIGFSAHAPTAKKTGIKTDWHLPDERLDEYIGSVNAARRRWAGKLPVYLGLEADYIKDLTSPADKDFQSLGLDYIIGSVHYIFPPKGGEPFTVDPFLSLPIPAFFGGFALNTHKHVGHRLQAFLGDTLAALHAEAVFALLYPGQSGIYQFEAF